MTHVSRYCSVFALLCAVLLPSPATAAGPGTDPAVIRALAAEAYVWGLGPEFVERSSKYNTIIGAPFNTLPNRGTGLSGTALSDLPGWMVPQYGAETIYLVPSFGQKATLDKFAPLGLTKKGFLIPAGLGIPQRLALQEGYLRGQKFLGRPLRPNNSGS